MIGDGQAMKCFHAMGSTPRMLIVQRLAAETYSTRTSVKDLSSYTGMRSSVVSHHLQQLFANGIVNRIKDGQWTYYYLNRDKLRELIEWLESKT